MTEEPTKPAEGHGHAGPSPVAQPIDPEHDIDSRKTVFWLTAALLFVVLCLLVLGQVFSFSLSGQRYRKVDLVPAYDLRTIRSAEDFYLRGQEPQVDERSLAEIESSIDASTDRIIRAYVQKNNK